MRRMISAAGNGLHPHERDSPDRSEAIGTSRTAPQRHMQCARFVARSTLMTVHPLMR
jgi:hypothetical protein